MANRDSTTPSVATPSAVDTAERPKSQNWKESLFDAQAETRSNVQQIPRHYVASNVKHDDTFHEVADQVVSEEKPENSYHRLVMHRNDRVVTHHAITEIPMHIVIEPLNTSVKPLSTPRQRADNSLRPMTAIFQEKISTNHLNLWGSNSVWFKSSRLWYWIQVIKRKCRSPCCGRREVTIFGSASSRWKSTCFLQQRERNRSRWSFLGGH